MKYQTTLSSTWKKRQWFIAVFLGLLALWFFYDGAIGFPKKNRRFDAYQELRAAGREKEWAQVAAGHGWPTKLPEKRYSDVDLGGQFVLGGICLAAAVGTIGWYFASCRQRLWSDGEVIFGVGGERVPVASITGLDRRKWESKGIVYALYASGGRTKRLTLDDYKFTGAEALILEVETALAERADTGPGVDSRYPATSGPAEA